MTARSAPPKRARVHPDPKTGRTYRTGDYHVPMARKVITTHISDLSGKDADETIRFSLNDKHYRIDLTTKEASDLRKALDTYIDSAEKLPKREVAESLKRGTSTRGNSGERTRIREWARENGYSVGDRGRISQEIRDAYAAAN